MQPSILDKLLFQFYSHNLVIAKKRKTVTFQFYNIALESQILYILNVYGEQQIPPTWINYQHYFIISNKNVSLIRLFPCYVTNLLLVI